MKLKNIVNEMYTIKGLVQLKKEICAMVCLREQSTYGKIVEPRIIGSFTERSEHMHDLKQHRENNCMQNCWFSSLSIFSDRLSMGYFPSLLQACIIVCYHGNRLRFAIEYVSCMQIAPVHMRCSKIAERVCQKTFDNTDGDTVLFY